MKKLAASGILAVMAASALGLAQAGSARAQGGTGTLCGITGASVTKLPSETLYVYEADCPGRPLGWFGGNATAKYEVIGNWNPQTRTAREDLYSFDRRSAVISVWTCTNDPWITPAIYPGEGGWPSGHTCQVQSQRGGDDWTTDTNPPASFGAAMCFNDPWGASLEGCWSSDDVSVTGPSAAILRAWNSARARRVQPPHRLPVSPLPLPG